MLVFDKDRRISIEDVKTYLEIEVRCGNLPPLNVEEGSTTTVLLNKARAPSSSSDGSISTIRMEETAVEYNVTCFFNDISYVIDVLGANYEN
jgi:hypothetical protein